MQQAVPSLFSYWKELLGLFAGFSFLWVVVYRALRDQQFKASLDANKETVIDRINTWYAPRIAKIDNAMQMTGAHEDQMTAFEESILAQGKVLRDRIDEQFTRKAEILQTIGSTLISMQGEMRTMGGAILEMQTYLKTRDGAGPFGTRAGDNPAPRVRKRKGDP